MNSEDKKIKEELIELIGSDPRKERWLSWLEKQQSMNSEEMLDLLKMEYSKGRYDTITETVEWLSGFDEWGLQHITPEELVEDFKKYIEQ